ncbi:TonB family protein [candidate division WOR-3 bacterium]|nr:TonB family protein [candidate division WOR-3 bacterium]
MNRAVTLIVGALVVTVLALGAQSLLSRRRRAAPSQPIREGVRGDVVPAGDADERPRPTEMPAPEWPAGQVPSGPDSTVVVAVVVDTNGSVIGSSLVQGVGNDVLDDAALAAAMDARFAPATVDGVPVQVRVYLAYEYRP